MKVSMSFLNADVEIVKDKAGLPIGLVMTPKLVEPKQTVPLIDFRVFNNKDKEHDCGSITVCGGNGKIARKATKGVIVKPAIDE